MKAAKLENSQRLQRVDRLLSSGRTYTTREIIDQAHVCAVNSIAAELRSNGRVIDCWRVGDTWYYRRDLMAEKQKVAA